ncbi:DEAD/DEAH box helicase [Rhodovarius crocodyli]|uniref:DEAD/DEAH box helicase n=1 Tax=Rhodovarius crocodyli TaxID=1979269 RepID=A0A437MD75_9PROT|nr:DEAD/DEAH box helicase [Rhodovarius crocodyli]RVT95585.1 DEAD/DEAH box helicase [Rhodovarius crocodyli]
MSFTELGLAEPILRALTEEGYENPTPIQARAIPSALLGQDVLGIAQTGTGKTAAFGLPLLHRLHESKTRAPRNGFRALILSPTRELASQIADNLKNYSRHLKMSVGVIVGGVPHGPQRRTLSPGVDILVATPGRLQDHLDAGSATLRGVEILVLDEADQMLDKGFWPAIRRLLPNLPKPRHTMFFSATMPTEVAKLASEILNEPTRIEVTPVSTTAERVDQKLLVLDIDRKRVKLAELLEAPGVGRALVFARTKHGADRIVKNLEQDGINSNAIHGNKSQGQRERALYEFKKGSAPVLVATDIAARGIDVDGVTHVIQYDMPDTPEAYVHRIGRTARAGASGIAIAMCTVEEKEKLWQVQKLIRIDLPSEDLRRDKSEPMERVANRGGAPKRNGPKPPHRGRPQRAGGGGRPQGGPPKGGRPQGQRQGARPA